MILACFAHVLRVFAMFCACFAHVFELFEGLGVVSCLKPTSEKAGIGLRRENFGIPESKILKPSFS